MAGSHTNVEWTKPDIKEYIVYEPIVIKLNNWQKLSMIMKVVIVVTSRECWLGGDGEKSSGAWKIFDFDMVSGYMSVFTFVKSIKQYT